MNLERKVGRKINLERKVGRKINLERKVGRKMTLFLGMRPIPKINSY